MTTAKTAQDAPGLHLCIATGQNLANLIPALQLNAREVWVLQTPKMRERGGHLADALKSRGIRVQRIDFDDRDVAALHAQAEAVAERLAVREQGPGVTINLSGGTKLMTLALVQTLAAHLATGPVAEHPHVVYTDTEHRRLDWLLPNATSQAMASVLSFNDVLLAQGYRQLPAPERAQRQRLAEEREDLTRWLGEQAKALANFFRAMNALAQQACRDERQFDPNQRLYFAPGGKAAEWLQRAVQLGLVAWDGAEDLTFSSADAARYLGGGWAEELVWLKVAGMQPDGHWAPGLRLQHVDSGSENELDTLLVHGNRLLLIESKSARTGDKAADWIYKLAQLTQQIGGAFARALLVSAQPLSEEQLRRAREYRVDVLAGADLSRLGAWLRDWSTTQA